MTARDAADEILAQVLEAGRWGRALRLRGGDTREWLGRPVAGEVLNLGAHRGVVDWEPSERVVTVRCGTPLVELERLLAGERQMLGFEPPRAGLASTVGGAIATGLSGPRRPYAGAARDFVLGVECLDGRGQRLLFGGRVMKNVAGYDLPRLMCGAQGTLGILLQVSLRLLPQPECELAVELPCEPLPAIERMNRLAGESLPLSGAAWHGGILRLRLSGPERAVRAAAQRLGGECSEDTAWWRALRDHRLPFFREGRTLWRVSLPSAAAPLALDAEEFLDWGGAQRWLAGDPDPALVWRRARELGGHASCWRGAQPAEGPFQPLEGGVHALHRALRKAFDPHRILNPGRLYRDL